ncbi:MAG: D-cysteine desulfhydrase family protein [Chloroflexi bacterium]|jgi:L-cysteate sulfo-lyase|nr:D-cysteine desulfhydrase family protein [Chloroflexota bacterium]
MHNRIPRVSLGHFPTPIDHLPRLSRLLGGPQIYVKRDDLTGLAGGGNKTRKLEYLIADALEQGATTVLTTGAVQSNHARQTAAAAARFGLRCYLVLRSMAPEHTTGNLLLDRLLGARVRWAGDRNPFEVMQEIANEERVAGRKSYIIPYGGSNPIGASAYVDAMEEAVRQSLDAGIRFDVMVFPSSSGGTQAGMVVGARAANFQGRVLGISVDEQSEPMRQNVQELAELTRAYLGLRFELDPEDIEINDDYLGGGYAVMGAAEREAIQLVAREEGLLLDPVYTGRAMAGLIDLIRQGAFQRDQTVLFWHTGGTPALYAYAHDLLAR